MISDKDHHITQLENQDDEQLDQEALFGDELKERDQEIENLRSMV